MDTKEKNRSRRKPAAKAPARDHRSRRSAPSGQKRQAQPAKRRAAQQKSRRTEQSRRAAVQTQQRKKRTVRRQHIESPEVVYTPPKPFNSAAFLLRLATVVAVVVAVVFGVSIFFRVQTVNVSGADKYTAWEIMEASGIKEGDNLLSLPKARISGRITAALPYIGSVRVEIQLPDVVNIEVTELDVVYAVQDTVDRWWLMTSEGKIVERILGEPAKGIARILGLRLDDPQVSAHAVAADNADDTVTQGSDRLGAALTILRYLEENSIIGNVDSVNVEDLGALMVWYDNQYQVKLGDTSQLEYKIRCMYTAIHQMENYRTGVLDITFTTWPDQIGFTPFEEE